MQAADFMTRVLITSALPYINGVKHLGNLVGSMLPADIYARFQRALRHETLFICATDEHGTPAELAALEVGQSVAHYCREQHQIQKDLGERFGLSWDYFGRSSSPQNHKLTQDFALGRPGPQFLQPVFGREDGVGDGLGLGHARTLVRAGQPCSWSVQEPSVVFLRRW